MAERAAGRRVQQLTSALAGKPPSRLVLRNCSSSSKGKVLLGNIVCTLGKLIFPGTNYRKTIAIVRQLKLKFNLKPVLELDLDCSKLGTVGLGDNVNYKCFSQFTKGLSESLFPPFAMVYK